LKRAIDQSPQTAVIRFVSQQHVRRDRLQVARQPAQDGRHPTIARRGRVLPKSLMVLAAAR
jgi:hypothetical protein